MFLFVCALKSVYLSSIYQSAQASDIYTLHKL